MLTRKEIQRQMAQGNIVIDNAPEKSFKKPNSVDVRLGNVLYEFDYSIVDMRDGKNFYNEVMSGDLHKLKRVNIPETGFLLQPKKVYLARTIEEVEAHGFVPVMHGKANMSLLGVSTELNCGYKYDGYKGPMLLSIIATKPTIIYPDIAIGNLTFFPSLGVTDVTGLMNGIPYGMYGTGMLSGDEIRKRMEGENPDIYIDDQSKIVINPNSVNLTFNNVIGIYEDPILDIKKPNAIKKMEVGDGMWLYPDEVYLGRTNEWTRTDNLVPMMSGRSSLGRNGLHVHCSAGMGSIGYEGYWHMGIRPTKPIWIVPDFKCCQIYYYTLEGEIENRYEGYMQNLGAEEIGSQMHRILEKKK